MRTFEGALSRWQGQPAAPLRRYCRAAQSPRAACAAGWIISAVAGGGGLQRAGCAVSEAFQSESSASFHGEARIFRSRAAA